MSKTEISFSGHDQCRFYKEYYKQKGHRYRKVGSKNFKNIASPSRVIHISNLIRGKDLEFYTSLFGKCGKIVKSMCLGGETPTILFEMENLRQSVEALVQFHNFEFNGIFLKVSFSKYDSIKGF